MTAYDTGGTEIGEHAVSSQLSHWLALTYVVRDSTPCRIEILTPLWSQADGPLPPNVPQANGRLYRGRPVEPVNVRLRWLRVRHEVLRGTLFPFHCRYEPSKWHACYYTHTHYFRNTDDTMTP